MPEPTMWPSLTFSDVYRALVTQRRKAAICFLAVTATVAIVTLLWPKSYRSEGKLLVRLGRENATLDATVTMGPDSVVAVPLSREAEINSHVEILQSRTLLEQVVDKIGPAAVLHPGQAPAPAGAASGGKSASRAGAMGMIGDALAAVISWPQRWIGGAALSDRDRAVAVLADGLHVAVPKKSDVVQVVYEGRTPELAHAVVAQLLSSYIDEHARLNRPQGSLRFFTEQAGRLARELAGKEAALRDLKTATGLASPEQQLQALVTRAARLQDELMQDEAAQAVSETRVQSLRRQVADLPQTRVLAQTDGFGNDGTDRMREQLYALQLKREEARSNYTAAHPKMQQLQEQIAEAERIVDRQPPTRTQLTTGASRFYDDVRAALLVEEPLLASLQAKTGVLRGQVAEVRGQLKTFNGDQMRIAALLRDVELRQADYRKYAANVEQARIDQALETERMSNLSIVQPASYEPRFVRPQTALNLALGLLLGLTGGVGVAVVADGRDRRLRTGEDVERTLGLTALGTIPQLHTRHLALQAGRRK